MESISGSDSLPHVIGLLEGSVSRLRRSYSKTPPTELAAAIHDRLHIIKHVLGYGLSRSHRRDVEASATWLTLLLATVYFDLGRSELAWVYRDVALQAANDLGHRELEAWAWETPAWFALMTHDYRDAVELCEQGQSTAPNTSVRIAVHMQEVRARARLGEHAETTSAIRRAQDAADRVPPAAHLDDHYTFDPSKIDFYAATAFLHLGNYREAERHARDVIAASSDPKSGNYWPTRVGSARMDLGMALARRGAVDVAAYEASQAFEGPFVRRSTLVRGQELANVLRGHSDVLEVREFLDRLPCMG
jgi:tetratricopeptide (TPR) repeat protein